MYHKPFENTSDARKPMRTLTRGLITAMVVLSLTGSVHGKTIPLSPASSDPPSICDSIAGNLVNNCGFETGVSITNWTTARASMGSLVGVNPVNPNSGSFAAFFGASSPPLVDQISQSIPTIAGNAYDVSFFLTDTVVTPGAVPNNQFTAMFGSTVLLSLINAAPFPYTEFDNTVLATGPSTTISFSAYNVPDFFYLDDVSVVPVPSPALPPWASLALLGTGLACLTFVGRRRNAYGAPAQPRRSAIGKRFRMDRIAKIR
jgi:hypothetical protein